ncbi:MAG: hypothetical protein AW07_01363 [Candidatus Accumulibacter sp. SK-11]|nr:MAG: hypothetical protein AW07_01363 [Candidatus Accumulibacter sp. SK-11]
MVASASSYCDRFWLSSSTEMSPPSKRSLKRSYDSPRLFAVARAISSCRSRSRRLT